MGKGKFGTAVNCMDGRVQMPVIEWLKQEFGLDYVDVITEPGPNKILAENQDRIAIESIKRRVSISVTKHGSKVIAIVGHYDCAGNPAEKQTQLNHLTEAEKTVLAWGFDVQTIKLWVDENRQVERLG